MVEQSDSKAKLEQLRGYLTHDPDNIALLIDAAEAAIDARQPDEAMALLDRAAALRQPGPRESNLAGLAAMQAKRFNVAAAMFEKLLKVGHDDPFLRFNLAWSRTALRDEEGLCLYWTMPRQ